VHPTKLSTLALCLLTPLASAGTPDAGYAATQLAAEPGVLIDPFSAGFDVFGVSRTLSNGDLITFDGLAIERRDATGALLTTYTTLGGAVFPGMIAVDAAETRAVVGESSTGDLFEVDLVGGGVTTLANVPFNYDGAFEPGGDLLVSAAVTGSGNDVVRVTPTGTVTFVANVPGFSGPVALDPAGNLFVGIIDPFFAPGSNRVLLFSAAQLTAGPLLGEPDAVLYSSGWDNAAYLAFDGASMELYLVENDFLADSEVYRVGASKASSERIAAGPLGTSMASLELAPGGGPAVFAAFQPAAGGVLRYNLTDFGLSSLDRFAVTPARPALSIASTGGAGPATVEVAGGLPDGTFVLFFGPAGSFDPAEVALTVGGLPPIFWGLDVGTHRFLPFLLPLDATGTGSFSFFDPGGLAGQVAFQALVTDPVGDVLGSSTGQIL